MNRRGFMATCAAGLGALAVGDKAVGKMRPAGDGGARLPTWLVGIVDTEHPWCYPDGTSSTIRHDGVTGFDSAPLTVGFGPNAPAVGMPALTHAVTLKADGVRALLAVYAPEALNLFGARVHVGAAFIAMERSGPGGEIHKSRLMQVACDTRPDAARRGVTYIVGVRAETPEAAIEAARPLLPAFSHRATDAAHGAACPEVIEFAILPRTTSRRWLLGVVEP